MVWNLFPFKSDLKFGKSHRVPNLGSMGAESSGWFNVSPKNSALDVMHGQACSHDEAANHQLPIAVAFWIIWIVSAEDCSSLMQNLMHIHCMNATTTQYTRSLNSMYWPHCLVQWSRYCAHMDIPVPSPWLPGYIDGTQTVLITVTMAGLFPERPCTPMIHHLYITLCAMTPNQIFLCHHILDPFTTSQSSLQ